MKLIRLFEDFDGDKKGMTAEEIKAAVDAGKTVHWTNPTYKVIKGKTDYFIKHQGGHMIGLTWDDETTLNGKPEEFYIAED